MLRIVCAFIVVVLLGGVIPSPASAQFRLLRVGFQQDIARVKLLPLMIPYYDGTMERERLKLEFEQFRRTDDVIDAVMQGEQDIAIVDPGQAAVAVARNLELVALGALVVKSPYWVIQDDNRTPFKLEKPEDLKDRQIAIPFYGSYPYDVIMAIEQKYGPAGELGRFKPATYHLDDHVNILIEGAVDMALLTEPELSYRTENGRLKIVAPFSDLDKNEPVLLGVVTTRDLWLKNRLIYQRFLSMIQRGLNSLHTDPDQAARTLIRLHPLIELSMLRGSVQRLVSYGVFPKDVVLDRQQWQDTLTRYQENGLLFNPQKPEATAVFDPFAEP